MLAWHLSARVHKMGDPAPAAEELREAGSEPRAHEGAESGGMAAGAQVREIALAPAVFLNAAVAAIDA